MRAKAGSLSSSSKSRPTSEYYLGELGNSIKAMYIGAMVAVVDPSFEQDYIAQVTNMGFSAKCLGSDITVLVQPTVQTIDYLKNRIAI